MRTGPTDRVEGALIDLRHAAFKGVLADGQLSSGLTYEIRLSDKSAVRDGVHLIITFPEATVLTPADAGEAVAILIEYIAAHRPPTVEAGRIVMNTGALLNRRTPHAHGIVPGSEYDIRSAPRAVDRWSSQNG